MLHLLLARDFPKPIGICKIDGLIIADNRDAANAITRLYMELMSRLKKNLSFFIKNSSLY